MRLNLSLLINLCTSRGMRLSSCFLSLLSARSTTAQPPSSSISLTWSNHLLTIIHLHILIILISPEGQFFFVRECLSPFQDAPQPLPSPKESNCGSHLLELLVRTWKGMCYILQHTTTLGSRLLISDNSFCKIAPRSKPIRDSMYPIFWGSTSAICIFYEKYKSSVAVSQNSSLDIC